MRNGFNPADWYWQKTDGTLFSSARSNVVAVDDTEFISWSTGGGQPTVWPRDEAGAQTDQALQDVLTPYGLRIEGFVNSDAVVVVYRSDLFRRCTDSEAEKIDGALGQQPVRMRRLFESVQSFRSDDELWSTLQTAAVGLFGKKRANELLAPSA